MTHLSSTFRRMLLLTFLILGAVGIRHTWILRSYGGDARGLLTDRKRAYGYFYTERFFSQVAQTNGAEIFTDALARGRSNFGLHEHVETSISSASFYVGGHRKPVYTEMLIPRGLVGHPSTVL